MKSLRSFRQLPRLLQTLTWLGVALSLVAMALLIAAVVLGASSLRTLSEAPSTDHVLLMLKLLSAGMALGMIGSACSWPANMYRARLRHPERPSLRLETWQTQIMAALALAILPLCSLALTPLLSFTSILFIAPFALNVIEALVLIAASIWVVVIAIG